MLSTLGIFTAYGDYTAVYSILTFTNSDEDHGVSVALSSDEVFEDTEHFFAELVLAATTLPVQLDVPWAELDIVDQSGTAEHAWQSCTTY